MAVGTSETFQKNGLQLASEYRARSVSYASGRPAIYSSPDIGAL